MKQFLYILRWEFLNLVKAKAYIITTVVFIIIALVGFSVPTMMGGIGDSNADTAIVEQDIEKRSYAVYDPTSFLTGADMTLQLYLPNATFMEVTSVDALKQSVTDKKVDAALSIHDGGDFTYYVKNNSLTDTSKYILQETFSQIKRNHAFADAGIDANQVMDIYYSNTVSADTVSLGADATNSMIYTFPLIMLIYMVVVLYGNIIATTVASEKGNRTMELLVTSANSNALIFGKVLAGVLAAILQVGLFVSVSLFAYSLNRVSWGGLLDSILNIPMEIIVSFALFGIFGFIFYAFIFGAIGALVSKSEDVNSSATPLTFLFLIIYFVVYFGVMVDPGGVMFTAASMIPLSSPMAMFARMAVVDVPLYQVIVAFILLLVSTVLTGFGAAKIYRRGTLMYGNQVKLSHALKWLRKKD